MKKYKLRKNDASEKKLMSLLYIFWFAKATIQLAACHFQSLFLTTKLGYTTSSWAYKVQSC